MTHQAHTEILRHYRCRWCQGWWSIGDGSIDPCVLYCPWCGTRGAAEKTIGQDMDNYPGKWEGSEE